MDRLNILESNAQQRFYKLSSFFFIWLY